MRSNLRVPAVALLSATAIAGCGGSDGSGKLSDQYHRNYLAGCTDSGQTKAGCECLWEELTKKRGFDSQDKLKRLMGEVQDASRSSNPGAAMPAEFREAALACKSKLG